MGHPAYRNHKLRSWVRLARWRIQCLCGIPASIPLARWSACFFLPPRWGGEGTAMIYVFRDEYERELMFLDRLVRPGHVVIDAGASCGIYTVAAGKLVGPDGRVIAVEPAPRSAETLRRNVALNELDRIVVVHEAALSREVGHARLYQPSWGPVAASIAVVEAEGIPFTEVDTVSIDSIVEEQELERLDFVKLDIEGAEKLALQGAQRAIARWHPSFVFEMNPGATSSAGGHSGDVWDFLAAEGYELLCMSGSGSLDLVDSAPEAGKWAFRNFVARHPHRRPASDRARD
jgi:FkbM family methyltransferase